MRLQIQSLVLLLLVLLTSTAARDLTVLGHIWIPINDVNNPYVIDLANFAVNEDDRLTGVMLQFEKVIKAEYQIEVINYMYHLVLSANNTSISNKYEALVSVNKWDNFRNLTSFRALRD
ncbi:cysteine proteinase inhibitor A-like [Cicer arietinum]|uniref:Cystatin-1-like n=1 Tax=Cicer arietinum TaxID=3827 RepID=A0A1S2XF47_CICAR|nr:cystatin-1-like [Cicer arietinum]